MGKQGLQREMDSFFRETENEEFNIRRITKGVDYLGYHGHKLLAVDGTFLNLPNHESIHRELRIRPASLAAILLLAVRALVSR
jgi:hypothetical protein